MEARQEQAATADILRAISRSTNNLKPVLDAIAETAAHLCGAGFAFVYRLDADAFHLAASSNAKSDWVQYVKNQPVGPGRGTIFGRTLLERRTIHVEDVLADREYADVQRQRLGKYRTALGVPLLRDQTPIGAIILVRRAVKPFSSTQIKLVETFADQAAIAIENVRLFEAVEARTRDLTESLEQQTATSEVLQIISSKPGELEPVFQTMLGNATRICGANFGTLICMTARPTTQLRSSTYRRHSPLRASIPTFAPTRKAVSVRSRGPGDRCISPMFGKVSHTWMATQPLSG